MGEEGSGRSNSNIRIMPHRPKETVLVPISSTVSLGRCGVRRKGGRFRGARRSLLICDFFPLGKKQAEYCDWLLEEHSGLTLQQRQSFIYYLFKYNLIENQEVEKEMRGKLQRLFSPDDYDWFLDLFDDGIEEHKARFLQQTFKRMLDADNSIEAALKLIQSEEERRELIARLQQTSYQTVNTTTQQAAASA